MSSIDYWARRKAREEYKATVEIEAVARELAGYYAIASQQIEEDARRLVRRFEKTNNLTAREAEALLMRVRDTKEIKAIIRELKKNPKNRELVTKLESQAYGARLGRLVALQNSVDNLSMDIYRKCNSTLTSTLEEVAKSAYYREIFGMQQRTNAGFQFALMTEQRVMEILSKRWSGESYSERLWQNTGRLAKSVKREIMLDILTGKSQSKMTQSIQEEFHSGATETRRLVRTEANFVANEAAAQSYAETEVEKYIYVAILDLRTSAICRSLDNKQFQVAERQVGKNYPPMHPWCRSTTIPWMPDKLLSKLERSAVDPVTGERIYIPASMSYDEWYDKFVRDKEEEIKLEKGEWFKKIS